MTSIFIEVDLVQAEWVVTAYYCQDARMLEVVEEGLDPHIRTGHLISGAPEDFILREAEAVGHTTDPVVVAEARRSLVIPPGIFLPRNMSIRQAGKKSNHGLNYDERYKTFALENGMAESDAARCCDSYHRAYRGLKSMYKAIGEILKTTRTLENCFGEKRVFWTDIDDNVRRSAYAQIPQSTVARVTNNGLVSIYEAREPILRKVEPLANVHDSVLNQTRVEGPKELLPILQALDRTMKTGLMYHGREFVLDREIKIGHNWGEHSMVTIKDLTLTSVAEAWEDAIKKAA